MSKRAKLGGVELCWELYFGMAKALKKGRGFRLSAQELEALYTFDTAVNTAVANECERRGVEEP